MSETRRPHLRLSLFLGGAVLVLTTGWTLLPKHEQAYFKPDRPLRDMLPTAPPGWTTQDVPLGATEQLQAEVGKILRYTDAIYRVYRRNGQEVGVYVAYWKPGEGSITDSAVHTPDICWTGAGWRQIAADDAREYSDAVHLYRPAQFRTFEAGTRKVNVLFWHLYGGRLSGYGMGPSSGWVDRFHLVRDYFKDALGRQTHEVVFVRLSWPAGTSEPPAEIMRQLPDLGWYQPAAGHGGRHVLFR